MVEDKSEIIDFVGGHGGIWTIISEKNNPFNEEIIKYQSELKSGAVDDYNKNAGSFFKFTNISRGFLKNLLEYFETRLETSISKGKPLVCSVFLSSKKVGDSLFSVYYYTPDGQNIYLLSVVIDSRKEKKIHNIKQINIDNFYNQINC